MIVTPGTTIADLAAALRRRVLTAAALVEECLATIAARDDTLNAFILVRADEARAEARAADRELARGEDRGPLHGIPVSLKDVIDLAGTPTTAATAARAAHRAAADAAVAAHLRAAGAVVIGKCNLHELAFGTTGEASAFGPTRNPHDPQHVAGGSSGGSAVSVSTGMALASIGTDTGGSIRIPASACGVVGLKPAFGEVSVDGVLPLAPSLDHVGPIARSVRDAETLFRVLREPAEKAARVDGRIARDGPARARSVRGPPAARGRALRVTGAVRTTGTRIDARRESGVLSDGRAVGPSPLARRRIDPRRGDRGARRERTSGAGKGMREDLHFSELHDNTFPYKVGEHRHIPEIEHHLGAEISFVTQLMPFVRGLNVTAFVRPTGEPQALRERLAAFYEADPT